MEKKTKQRLPKRQLLLTSKDGARMKMEKLFLKTLLSLKTQLSTQYGPKKKPIAKCLSQTQLPLRQKKILVLSLFAMKTMEKI
jgi:hypothetical protein